MNQRSLLSMKDLTPAEILRILDEALLFNDIYKDWQLPLKKAMVANLFFEPSTRTHYSFESAEWQLGCQVTDVAVSQSSVTKGESLYDTVKTLETIGYGALVIRHPQDAYYRELDGINIPILNAGDGAGDHPTQCLLDLLTIYKEFGTLEGLTVLICGDILHSRVAASNKEALEKLGSRVLFYGPREWQRPGYETADIDDVIDKVDAVMMLRVQLERGAALEGMPGAGLRELSEGAYLNRYGLTKERYDQLKDNAIVLHPAPVNRGIEIDTSLVEAEKSRIFPQMANGVLVRKAVLKRAFGIDTF